MINNTEWKYVYKLAGGETQRTNVLYTPTISPTKDKLCMHFWTESPEYMATSCVPRTDELMQFWFEREAMYLEKFQGYSWCPTLYDIDRDERKILIEFNQESLNWAVYTEGRSLEDYSQNWKEELYSVVKEIYDLGYYKNALYPHCFFYGEDGNLKTIDYYSVMPIDNPYVLKSVVAPIIGVDSQQRYKEVEKDEYYDASLFFKNTLANWVEWPDDFAKEIYTRIYGD